MISGYLKNHKWLFLCFLSALFFILNLTCDDAGRIPFSPSLNKKPIARFTYYPEEYSLKITFDASASEDKDGEIVKYEWNFGDLTIGEGLITFHAYEEPGKYIVELTVTDDDDAKASCEEEVKVYYENKPPIAVLRSNSLLGNPDFIFIFDGSGSHDPDGNIVNYTFQIIRRVDDTVIKTQTGMQNKLTYLFSERDLMGETSASYKVTLQVKDDRGGTDIAMLAITLVK